MTIESTRTSVFVVEDEALIAMELQDRLAALGYSVCGTASRGENAIEAIAASPPDVVLMDVRLAGTLTGIDTAARLRDRLDVPVIFLSAYSDAELLRKACDVQPFGYLVKPFEERELHATIQMALYKHKMERALRESNTRLDEKVRERTAELTRSREDLAVTLDSIGDAVLATDNTGRVTRMNPVAEELTGWTQAEAIGRPIAEVFHIINEQTRQPALIPVDTVLATGERQSLANHTALIARNGTERSITDSAAPIRDSAGRIAGVVLVFRDETEARDRRKLVARQGTILGALRRVQEQFINSPDATPPFEDILSVLLYATSSDSGLIGEVRYADDGQPLFDMQAVTGFSRSDDAPPGFGTLPDQEQAPKLSRLLATVMTGGSPVFANEGGEASDGDVISGSPAPFQSCLGVPILVSGQVVGLIGVANRPGGYDESVLAEIQPLLATCGSIIQARRGALRRRVAEESLRELNASLEAEVERRTAERRSVEEALRESEERLRELTENMQDMLCRIDRDGRFVYVSPSYRTGLGYRPGELLGETPQSRIHPEDRGATDEALHYVLQQGAPRRWELRFRHRDGRYIWLAAVGSAIRDAAGVIVGVVVSSRDITERTEARHQLSASLAMFETLAALSPVGIVRMNAAAECLYVNQRYCEILGIAREQALGQGWTRTELHPDDRERVVREWERALRLKQVFHEDCRFVRPDGQTVWVLAQSVPTLDARGNITGHIGTLTDVTEQKQMERALRVLSTELIALEGGPFYRLMAQRLATLLECDIAMVANVRADQKHALQTLAVFEDGELAGNFCFPMDARPWAEVADHHAVVIPNGSREGLGHDPWLTEKRIQAFAAVALIDRAGACIGQLAVMSRHALANPARVEAILHVFALSATAEIEQQRSAQRFHDLFEFSPDAIVMTDRKGSITLVNRKAETMFGWSRSELSGRGIEVLMPEEDRSHHVLQRERFVEAAGSRAMGAGRPDLHAKRKDGTVFPVEISLGSIETGEGLMIAAAIRDITDRQNAERHARRARRLESIGTLAGGIAHDLNNALTPILLMLDLLKEQYPADHETLDTIERSANHAAEMVRHLLAFAKGSEGRRISLHPRRLIEETEKIVRGTFPKNIDVRVRAQKDLPSVVGDTTQLHQVLLNLCVNARDAMPEGGTLTLEAELVGAEATAAADTDVAGPTPSHYVVMRVTDTGTGIPAEVLERIFDPFFTTKAPDSGTGLGLFTVAGIVKGHGGFIRVYSQPSRGSTFAVYLPAEDRRADTETVPVIRSGFSGRGETVLYVDDESAVREAARTVLERLNFSPLLANDGMGGLLQAVQHRDVLRAVITDLHMPKMDGLAFVRALRGVLPNVPVIVASGRLESTPAQELRQLGVQVMLEKPFTQEKLAEALQAALQPEDAPPLGAL